MTWLRLLVRGGRCARCSSRQSVYVALGIALLSCCTACSGGSMHPGGFSADAATPLSSDERAPDASDASDAGAPAAALEQIQIAAGRFVFDARAAGPSGGALVLLLHGFPETSYQYRSQLAALADAGYRAVAPNQRGYSPGARPSAVADYGVLNLAQDIVQIADALGRQQFHLVGHDWGGGVAWTLARLYPERVLSLTVLSTPHPDAMNDALSDPSSCQHQASAYFDAFTGPDALSYVRGLGSDSKLGFACLSDSDQQEYLRIVLDDDALNAALNWYRANVKDRKFSLPSLGDIAVPTVYLWGAEDPTFCRETAEGSARYVTAEYSFVELASVGHWLTDCVPDVVNAHLLAHLAAHAAPETR